MPDQIRLRHFTNGGHIESQKVYEDEELKAPLKNYSCKHKNLHFQ